MEIRSKEAYENFKKTLPKEMVEHPAFKRACDWNIEDFLSNGYTLSAELSEDKTKLFVRSSVKVFRGSESPHSVANGLDIILESNGRLSSTQTYGELYDAVPFYQSRPQARKNVAVGMYDSVLSASYYHTSYDSKGIVMSTSSFGKSNWGLNNLRFDDERSFKEQLFSSGYHKPSEWYYDGRPKLPAFCAGGYVNGVVRDPAHPGIATTYGFDCVYGGHPINTVSYLGHVHGEWPHVLRVDHYEQFAVFKNGRWEVTDEIKKYYPGMSVDELRKMFALQFMDALESSETKKCGLPQYKALKEMTEKANLKYSESGMKM